MKNLGAWFLFVFAFSFQGLAEERSTSSVPANMGLVYFMTVLDGVLYRGGSSNSSNHWKPLSIKQQSHLVSSGFTKSFFVKQNKKGAISSLEGLDYEYAFAYRQAEVNRVLAEVYQHIVDPSKGKVLVHCYGGWHASGLVAAMALIQFCGWSRESAVAYWESHTAPKGRDPNIGGSSYNTERSILRNFKYIPDLEISEADKARVCQSAR